MPQHMSARRRVASASAVLALIGASVFGGAVVAAYAAGAPVFGQDTYVGALGNTVTLGGTGEVGDTVGINGIGGQCEAVTVGLDETWSCDVDTTDLGAGEYPIDLVSSMFAPPGDTATLTVIEEAGTITAPTARVTTLNASGNLLVEGTVSALVGTTVTLNAYYEYGNAEPQGLPSCVATASGGTWSCELTGVTTTRALHLSAFGSAPTAFATAEVEVLMPPTLTGAVGGVVERTGSGPATFAGTHDQTSDGGPPKYSTVYVRITTPGGAPVTTCLDTNRESPGWSCTTVDSLAYGTYNLYLSQSPWWTTDTSAEAVYTLNVLEVAQPVAITSPAVNALVTSSALTVSGTSGYTDGALHIALQGQSCDAPVAPSGAWTCDVNLGYYGYDSSTSPIDVTRAPSATVLASRNVSVLRPPSVYGDDDGGNLVSYTGTVSVNGEAYLPGETEGDTIVRLTLTDGEGVNLTCTTTVYMAGGEGEGEGEGEPYGAWDCTFPGTLEDGTYTVTVTQQPSWAGAQSEERVKNLYVEIGGGGLDVLTTCSFGPGAITVGSSSPYYDATLYRVDPGATYQATDLGECGGRAGVVYTDPFVDNEVGSFQTCAAVPAGLVGFSGSSTACTASALTPGLWNIYYSDGDGGGSSFDWFFRVPNPPTVTAQRAASDGRALFTGTGTPGDTVTVTGIAGAGEPLCSATVTGAGFWACAADVGYGSRQYYAYQSDTASGGASPFSALSNELTLIAPVIPVIVDPPAPIIVTPPTVIKVPLVWTLIITGVDGPLRPGQWVGLSSSGIPAGSTVDAELHSTPKFLGTTTVLPDGTFNYKVQIPFDVEEGDHEIVVTVTPPGDDPSPVQNPVRIEYELPTKVVSDPVEKDDSGSGSGSSDQGISRNDPSSPTALTKSIPTLFEILTNPVTIGIAAGLALIIMLLVAIPAEVLNSTIESNTERFGGFFGRIQRGLNAATEWFIRVTRTPVVASALLVVLTSIIFGFVDPGFGFDLASLRLVLSVGAALFIVTFVASRITGAIIGRAWSLESEIGMQPAALLFAVLGVVVARALDFSPGFLVGLVIGLELSNRASELQRVRAIVIEFSVIVGLGVLAWLGYSIAIAVQGDAPLDFFTGFVQDTLVAVTSEGLTAVMIALVPIAFLDGKKIFERSKRLWVLIFVIVATAFSLLVLPTALAGQEIANIGWWVAVLIGFAAITFAVTLWLRATTKSGSSTESTAKVDA